MATYYRKVVSSLTHKRLVHKLLALSTAFALSCLTQPALAELTPYQAEYNAKIGAFSATLHRSLEPLANQEADTDAQSNKPSRWLLNNKASVLFAGFDEQSTFFISNKNITPLHYVYNNHLSKKRSKDILFNWEALTATNSKGKKQGPVSFTDEAFDQLSYQLQLRLDLMNDKSFCERTFTIVDAGKLKYYTVQKLGEEWLETAAGKLLTVKLEQTRAGKSRRTLIWMAKDWEYLVVKLQRFEDGESEQLLELKEARLGDQKVRAL